MTPGDKKARGGLRASDVQQAAGLTYRQLNVWGGKKALPADPTRGRGWRRFTPRELFSVMLAGEMRKRFNLPLDRLSRVGKLMLAEGRPDYLRRCLRLMDQGASVWVLTDCENVLEVDSEPEIRARAFSGESFVAVRADPLARRLLDHFRPAIWEAYHRRVLREAGLFTRPARGQLGRRTPTKTD